MKNIIKYKINPKLLLAATLVIVLSGCSDYLERTPKSQYLSSDFFNNEEAIKEGASGCYQMLYQNLESYSSIPPMVLWDCYTPFGIERADNSSIGVGNIDLTTNYSVEYTWATLYTSVARCNTVLDGATPYINGLGSKAKQYFAETKMLRVYYYWELVSLYGDIPYFATSVTDDQLKNIPRTPWKQVVDSLLTDIDGLVDNLSWKQSSDADWGRIDKSFAYGMKARLALYAGSWCKFGFGKGGVQDAANATKYFTIAADAAKKVMDESGRGLCSDYNKLFTRAGQLTTDAKNENIMQMIFSDQGATKTHYLSAGEVCRTVGGQSGRFPTQQLVDTYESSNGKRIDDHTSGYDPKNPFANRDPRLKYSIYTQHDTIIGNTGTKKSKILMELYSPKLKSFDAAGNVTMIDNLDYTGSVAQYGYIQSGVGYLWRKYDHFDDEGIFVPTYNFMLMRYAEILLTFAEAKIELNQLDVTVSNAIDQVRSRVGMPSILIADPTRAGNQDKMRQVVRRERKVELVKESLFLFDMRRWRIGALQNAEPTYGYPIATGVNAATNTYPDGYSQVTSDMVPSYGTAGSDRDMNDIASYASYATKLRNRDVSRPSSWDDRYYVWPIPQTERKKAPWLTQNDGYPQ